MSKTKKKMEQPLVKTRRVVRSLAFKYVSHPSPKTLLWRGRYAHIVFVHFFVLFSPGRGKACSIWHTCRLILGYFSLICTRCFEGVSFDLYACLDTCVRDTCADSRTYREQKSTYSASSFDFKARNRRFILDCECRHGGLSQ